MRKYLFLIMMVFAMVLSIQPVSAAGDTATQAKMMVLVQRPAVNGNINKTKELFNDAVNKMLEGKNIDIIDQDKTTMIARTYAEDHALRAITSHDLQAMAIQAGADYIMFVQIGADNFRASAGFLNASVKMTVICMTRIMDVKTGEYIASGSATVDGKSRAILGGIPSMDHAFNDALTQCLDKVAADINAKNLSFPVTPGPAKLLPDLTK